MGADQREVRDEVEQARRQLGETIEALAYKVNAPRRIRDDLRRRFTAVRDRLRGT